MALDNKMRNRLGNNGGKFAGRQTNRGASGRPNSRFVNRGAGPSGIQDAREVLQAKTHRRIMRTPSGLLTTRKANGITTSQLRNRQMRPTSARVGAAIRKSAVINSNPLLQSAILEAAGQIVRQRVSGSRRPQTQKPVKIFKKLRPVEEDDDMVEEVVVRRRAPLASSVTRALASIPRAQLVPFAAERSIISDRMRSRLDSNRADAPCSVLVSNLHANVSEADIKELFRSVGPTVSSSFVSPGTALVAYHRKTDAVKACQTYHLRLLDSQPMTCVLLTHDMVPAESQPKIPEHF